MTDALDHLIAHVTNAGHPLPSGEAAWVLGITEALARIEFEVLLNSGVLGRDIARLRHFIGIVAAARNRLDTDGVWVPDDETGDDPRAVETIARIDHAMRKAEDEASRAPKKDIEAQRDEIIELRYKLRVAQDDLKLEREKTKRLSRQSSRMALHDRLDRGV